MSVFFEKNAFEDVTCTYSFGSPRQMLTLVRDCNIASKLDCHRAWLLPHRCLPSFNSPSGHSSPEALTAFGVIYHDKQREPLAKLRL